MIIVRRNHDDLSMSKGVLKPIKHIENLYSDIFSLKGHPVG